MNTKKKGRKSDSEQQCADGVGFQEVSPRGGWKRPSLKLKLRIYFGAI
jgi:hypothetical protein